MDQNTEKRQSEKNDKVGEYLVHHLDNMLFDELSDEYLKGHIRKEKDVRLTVREGKLVLV